MALSGLTNQYLQESIFLDLKCTWRFYSERNVSVLQRIMVKSHLAEEPDQMRKHDGISVISVATSACDMYRTYTEKNLMTQQEVGNNTVITKLMSSISDSLCWFMDKLFVNLCPLEVDRFPFLFLCWLRVTNILCAGFCLPGCRKWISIHFFFPSVIIQ